MMKIFDEVIITSSSGSGSGYSEPSTGASNNVGIYIGIIVGAVVILVGVALLIYFLKKRKK